MKNAFGVRLDMDIEKFLKDYAANWSQPTLDPKGLQTLGHSTPFKPKDYIAFAEADISQGDERGALNGYSNAKRAVDCQVENVFLALGFGRAKNFPLRLQKIEELGLVAPRIVKKIVKIRNALEHDFARPKIADAEDAVDVATLFVEATNRLFYHSYMHEWYVGDKSLYIQVSADEFAKSVINGEVGNWRYKEGIYFQFSPEEKDFEITLIVDRKEASSFIIKPDNDFFIKLVRFTMDHDMDGESFDEVQSAMFLLKLMEEYKK
jgi:hypothetical protein